MSLCGFGETTLAGSQAEIPLGDSAFTGGSFAFMFGFPAIHTKEAQHLQVEQQ